METGHCCCLWRIGPSGQGTRLPPMWSSFTPQPKGKFVFVEGFIWFYKFIQGILHTPFLMRKYCLFDFCFFFRGNLFLWRVLYGSTNLFKAFFTSPLPMSIVCLSFFRGVGTQGPFSLPFLQHFSQQSLRLEYLMLMTFADMQCYLKQ